MTKSQQRVEATKTEVKRLWNLLCEAEGIPVDSKFVVFEPSNPFSAEYNNAVSAYQAAVKAERKNAASRARHAAFTSCGLRRVAGALHGVC